MEVKVKLGDVCGGVGRWEVCAAEEVRALLWGLAALLAMQ